MNPCFKFETRHHSAPVPPDEGPAEIKWPRFPEKLTLDERAILGRYLHLPPMRVVLAYGAYGKPKLAASLDWSRLHFNVSHSEGLALYAVALGREVGVDIERARPIPEMEHAATQVFSDRENTRLHSLSYNNPVTVFFRFWTCKEALLKARGGGFSESVKQTELPPYPEREPGLADHARDRRLDTEWTLRELNPRPGFAAALVVEGRYDRLSCWDYRCTDDDRQLGRS